MAFKFIPGAYQSPPDPRDYIYTAMVGKAEILPPYFFWDRLPARDQGRYGTCCGFAAAGVKDRQETVNYPGRGIKTSPLFIYRECKRQDGIPDKEGTYPRVVMKVLQKLGTCREETFPYSLMGKPLPDTPQEAYEEAKQFTIGAYARVQTLDEIKQAIFRDGPILAGVLVTESFINAKDGVIPEPTGRILGLHAICIDGFTDEKKQLRFANSWGEDWGDSGYGWIPYDLVNWRADVGIPFLVEAWSSVDVLLPPKQAKKVELWVGKRIAVVDGEEIELDVAPEIKPPGRALVPIRFLSEVQNWYVQWDGKQKKITLINVNAKGA